MESERIIELLRERHGITDLNAMQQAAMRERGGRLRLIAPTGSGKTVAFSLAMLRKLRRADGMVQAVVIVPSRELVLQIYEVVRPLAPGYKTVAFYGGHPMEDEVRSATAVVPDIVIATPGRLLDHLQRGTLSVGTVHTLVLDEYDKSLEAGFHGEMKRIVARMTRLENIILTSATSVVEIPDFIPVGEFKVLDFSDNEASGAPRGEMTILHVPSPARDKLDALLQLVADVESKGPVMIFVNHRESAERLAAALKKHGVRAGLYHGALDQQQRDAALIRFSNGTTPVLVATDLAARGLDIDGVGSVIHYHLPPTAENWTHRNGRTARQGTAGTVYVITSEADTIPDYVEWNHDWYPDPDAAVDVSPHVIYTLYIGAGKKEKISKGDVAGFLIKSGGVEADSVGRIDLRDHCAYAAVRTADIRELIKTLNACKLKGHRVRVSLSE
ncbi:MAG: DEAD/DEAH box helicase [Muribaculaceae bacterium]|nr:DEAD/DEAH box helicase [Muribaculaceae bacterium]